MHPIGSWRLVTNVANVSPLRRKVLPQHRVRRYIWQSKYPTKARPELYYFLVRSGEQAAPLPKLVSRFLGCPTAQMFNRLGQLSLPLFLFLDAGIILILSYKLPDPSYIIFICNNNCSFLLFNFTFWVKILQRQSTQYRQVIIVLLADN